jgi:hypothetical protein
LRNKEIGNKSGTQNKYCVLVKQVGWGNKEAVSLVWMITETNWLGNKTVCYFRFCPKDGEVPMNKDAVIHNVP